MEYTSPWVRFELTTLVVIGTESDCIGYCKPNYHTITVMRANVTMDDFSQPATCRISITCSLFVSCWFLPEFLEDVPLLPSLLDIILSRTLKCCKCLPNYVPRAKKAKFQISLAQLHKFWMKCSFWMNS